MKNTHRLGPFPVSPTWASLPFMEAAEGAAEGAAGAYLTF